MKYLSAVPVLLIVTMFTASIAGAARETIIINTPTGNVKTFKFKSSHGDVTFNHDLHVRVMKKEACIPCHRVESPTPEYVNSRFEERTAHYFCKGCHREKGMGPTECHECHKRNKTGK